MKRKHLASVLAGLLFAPAAFAQSEPVTMYGRLWLMFNNVKADGGANPVPSRNTVADGSSLLGFRGSENLGGGLKAIFQIESAISPDTGTSVLASRNSAVGLSSDRFGTVMLGRWDSPFKLSAIFVDPTSQITISNQLSVINTGNFNRRENNTIQYLTPEMGGFNGRLMYSANEERTATVNPSLLSASIDYANGPFRINYANERHKAQRGESATAGVTEVGQNLAGTFTFGAFKLGLLGQQFKSTGRTTRKAYQASVTYSMAGNRFFLTLGQNKNGAVSTAVQPESKLVAVGYDYEFSKRTAITARYASMKNNAASSANLSGSDLPSLSVNADPKGWGIGIRHTF